MTRVVAVNIPHSHTPKQARHDSELAMSLGDVVLACEVDRSNDGPFDDAAHKSGKRVVFRGRKTQVAFPASWRSFTRLQRTLTEALTGVNPARDLNGVADCDTRTIYWAAHMTNGKNKPGKSYRLWRGIQWRRYERRAARKVAKWNARGWHQIIGGDLNDRNGARFHERQETAAHAGLMWLIAIPAPGHYLMPSRDHVTRSNKGDHPVVWADVEFRKGPR